MWVTAIRKGGPITSCTGWLLRIPWPFPPNIGGGRQRAPEPIIEPDRTFVCPAHYLRPYP